jgi:hypothetical protein
MKMVNKFLSILRSSKVQTMHFLAKSVELF